ncbi:DUF3703 domain-containing protein [Myxococcus fulvus]|uniref:DUF3703 domain-containing protein n=1 Tax=Myxococcus fulvus TaxID=33 RepID=UPI003B9CB3C2
MTPTLRTHFDLELRRASEAHARGAHQDAWHALERAHILSQAHAWPHLRVHGAMLRWAVRHGDWRELLGQLPRLVLAAPGSWSGRAPLGNTGGASVGIFTPMAIPEDLRAILDAR